MTLRPDISQSARAGHNVNVVADEAQDGSYEIKLQSQGTAAVGEDPPATEAPRISAPPVAVAPGGGGLNFALIAGAIALVGIGAFVTISMTRSPAASVEAPPDIVAPEPVSGFQVYQVEYDPRRVITPSISPVTSPDAGGGAIGNTDGSGDLAAPVEQLNEAGVEPVEGGAAVPPGEPDAGVEEIDPAVIERIREVRVEIGDQPVFGQPVRRADPIVVGSDASP